MIPKALLHQMKELRKEAGVCLEMTARKQARHNLPVTVSCSGKMERSRLRKCAGMRYADLDPILEELEKEGRLIRLPGKEMIILKSR